MGHLCECTSGCTIQTAACDFSTRTLSQLCKTRLIIWFWHPSLAICPSTGKKKQRVRILKEHAHYCVAKCCLEQSRAAAVFSDFAPSGSANFISSWVFHFFVYCSWLPGTLSMAWTEHWPTGNWRITCVASCCELSPCWWVKPTAGFVIQWPLVGNVLPTHKPFIPLLLPKPPLQM